MMTDGILTYTLGNGIVAFTTDRTVGRDSEKITEAVWRRLNDTAGGAGQCRKEQLRFARPHQTHDDKVMPVAEEYFSLTEQTQRMLMEGKDAVMTDMAQVILGVSTADCIPVLLYDPEHHAAAAVHAGWRGTVKRIVRKTLEQMRLMYHTDAAVCRAAIGPGISLDSFEVGDEVYATFVQAGFDMNGVAQRYPVMRAAESTSGQTEKWHIDLKEINRRQMMMAGLMEENIEVSTIDTLTDTRFYSARREQKDGIKCGRIFTGFVIRP